MASIVIYKICDSTRLRRFVIPSYGSLSSLLEQGSIALEKNVTQVLTDQDGCRITTDLVLNLFKDKLLMLLEPNEMWNPVETLNPPSDGTNMESDDTANEEQNKTQSRSCTDNQALIFDVDPSMFIHPALPTSNIISVGQFPTNIPDPKPGTSQELTLSILGRGDSITGLHDENLSQQSNQTIIETVTEEQDERLPDEDVESCSPNAVDKRGPSTVMVQKSTKKFASTALKFQCFQINWNKISDHIIGRLRSLQKFSGDNPGQCAPLSLQLSKTDWSGITNSIVDQLRSIDTEIQASTMEKVAKDIVGKYPCLNFLDDDGYGKSQAYVWIKHKMLNRNSYLNRFKQDNGQEKTNSDVRRNRNVRAGTDKAYWEKSSKECSKEILSILARNEPETLTQEFLQASQSYVRYRLDEAKPLKDVLNGFPVLRRKLLLEYHFESATGASAKSLAQYFAAKRSKLIDYSKTQKKAIHLDATSSDVDVFRFLCSLLREKLEDVIISKEIGTKLDGISTDCSGPVLVAIDLGNEKRVYYVFAEQVRLTEGVENVVAAISDLVCVHYVHNFMYMRQISKFLEFVQEYFFKILPVTGSKSSATRKGQQQRVVTRVIKSVAEYCAQ